MCLECTWCHPCRSAALLLHPRPYSLACSFTIFRFFFRLQGIEIVEDRFAGAVTLHDAFVKTVFAEKELGLLMHPEVVENNVHLYKVCTSL